MSLDKEKYVNDNTMIIKQVNGCRHFGPRLQHERLIPPEGCEVFVSRIPPICSQSELFKFFSIAGKVFDLRCMVNFEGHNRGIGYVRYYNEQTALKAIRILNKKEIRPKCRLALNKSTDQRTLLLGGISIFISQAEVEKEFNRRGSGDLLEVTKLDRPSHNPTYLIHFATHRMAAVVKRNLSEEPLPSHWGKSASLIWKPDKDVEERIRYKKALARQKKIVQSVGKNESMNSTTQKHSSVWNFDQINPSSYAGMMGKQTSTHSAQSTLFPSTSLASTSKDVKTTLPSPWLNELYKPEDNIPAPQSLSTCGYPAVKQWSHAGLMGEQTPAYSAQSTPFSPTSLVSTSANVRSTPPSIWNTQNKLEDIHDQKHFYTSDWEDKKENQPSSSSSDVQMMSDGCLGLGMNRQKLQNEFYYNPFTGGKGNKENHFPLANGTSTITGSMHTNKLLGLATGYNPSSGEEQRNHYFFPNQTSTPESEMFGQSSDHCIKSFPEEQLHHSNTLEDVMKSLRTQPSSSNVRPILGTGAMNMQSNNIRF